MLKSKKHNTQELWVAAWNNAKKAAKTPEGAAKARSLIEAGVSRIPTESTVYAWSGGKDALALEVLAEAAGVPHGVLGSIGRRWEYPSFLEHIDNSKPANVEVMDFGYTAEFMNQHPKYVFPETSKDAYFWFVHCNQAAYYGIAREYQAENVVLGHRTQDGNVCGGGEMVKGSVRKVFPMYDWKHEDVFLVAAYAGKELPGIYFHEGGFFQGTHAWPMRTGGRRAIEELNRIDRALLEANADIDKVARFLHEIGGQWS